MDDLDTATVISDQAEESFQETKRRLVDAIDRMRFEQVPEGMTLDNMDEKFQELRFEWHQAYLALVAANSDLADALDAKYGKL